MDSSASVAPSVGRPDALTASWSIGKQRDPVTGRSIGSRDMAYVTHGVQNGVIPGFVDRGRVGLRAFDEPRAGDGTWTTALRNLALDAAETTRHNALRARQVFPGAMDHDPRTGVQLPTGLIHLTNASDPMRAYVRAYSRAHRTNTARRAARPFRPGSVSGSFDPNADLQAAWMSAAGVRGVRASAGRRSGGSARRSRTSRKRSAGSRRRPASASSRRRRSASSRR